MRKRMILIFALLLIPYVSLWTLTPSSHSEMTSQALTDSGVISEASDMDALSTSTPYYISAAGAEDTAEILADYPYHETVVAIIDTGAELSHEDLADSLWVNEAEKNGLDNVDDDNNGYIDDVYGIDLVNNTPTPNPEDASAPLKYDAPEDDSSSSHGTHVSGIVGMNPDNTVGYAGIGYGTKIMIIKAGNYKNSFSYAAAIQAVHYAVDNGADVINMSFGSNNNGKAFSQALLEASQSCLLVAASGNDGKASSESKMYPASYPYVLGVMASDSTGELWSNSNYCDSSPAPYDILSPGASIMSTIRYNSYAEKSGTSMASPMVSASAAVIMGFLEANKSYDNREDLLADTKKYLLMSDSVYTYTSESGQLFITPRLNLKNSLMHIIEDLQVEEESFSPTPSATKIPATATTTPVVTESPMTASPNPTQTTFPATRTPLSTITPTVSPSTSGSPSAKPTMTASPTPTPTASPVVSPATTVKPSLEPALPTVSPTKTPVAVQTSTPLPSGKSPAQPQTSPTLSVNTAEPSSPSVSAGTETTTTSASPRIKATAAGSKKITLVLSGAKSSKTYSLYRSTKKGNRGKKVATLTTKQKKYTDSAVLPGKKYDYRLVLDGKTIQKITACFPKKISNIKAKKVSGKKYTFRWKKAPSATEYQIQVFHSKSGNTQWFYTKKTKITLSLKKSDHVKIRARFLGYNVTINGKYYRMN